uniref:Uncharacterized protein n=1 Tax=Lepeophtheirus salmonis TaxID=72036 RepID=A0A0K2UGI0_LEPSM
MTGERVLLKKGLDTIGLILVRQEFTVSVGSGYWLETWF